MSGGRVRKLAVLAIIGGIIAAIVKSLRGDPAPQFSNHPSVNGGPVVTPRPASPKASAPKAPTASAAAALERAAAEAATVADPAPQRDPEPEPAPEAASATSPSGDVSWVDPVDGACPDGYPIKAKLKSGIFHQPGGLAYDRTKPDRCYPTVETAEADGLRPPKR